VSTTCAYKKRSRRGFLRRRFSSDDDHDEDGERRPRANQLIARPARLILSRARRCAALNARLCRRDTFYRLFFLSDVTIADNAKACASARARARALVYLRRISFPAVIARINETLRAVDYAAP